MALLIIGIIFLIMSFVFMFQANAQLQSVAKTLRLVSIAAIIVGALSSMVIQIDAGMVGVKNLFGKVNDKVLESGLHLINPLTKIHELDARTQNYTMSGVHDEGDQSGDDAIRVLSSDGLEVTIDLTVLYRIIPTEAPKIIREIGREYQSVIVRPITRTKIRDNAVYYNAVDLYSTKREEFQNRIFKDISAEFKARGLELEELLVRNINLPESVKLTIESKINAEQEAQKMAFVLQKERQEAERKRVEAQGITDYQKILNSSLSDQMLRYETIKAYRELATSNNAKVVIMGDNKTPLILDGK
ncbi:MAG: prohibitin family protein [Sphingobacteriales bacterium]|nr:prohibitin family protein [Sphingobacteriales bacterium]